MAYLSDKVEIAELGGGQFRQTLNMKPVAVLQNGSYVAMQTDFVDGDATTPSVVSVAPLRARIANDGMRRLFPIQGDDTSYLEVGAPYIKVGGTWTQVSLGTPNRSANLMTWTRPQTITRVQHGGHFLKLDIELRGGFVPEDSMVAFPVGLVGLTRSGNVIRKNGVDVMQLRPLFVEDAGNLDDVRPVTNQFVNLSGQPYLLLTLPSLVGMSRPRIDPTLTLQPDATAGIDNNIRESTPTVNDGTQTVLLAGKPAGVLRQRGMFKFDVSSIPGTATVNTATLTLVCSSEATTTDYTVGVHRALTQWFEGNQSAAVPAGGENASTWNLRNANGSVAWAGGAGGGAGSDYATTATASTSITAPGTFNWNVLADVAAWVAGSATNHGQWLINASEATDSTRKLFVSSDGATAADRPKLVVDYTEASSFQPAWATRSNVLLGGGIS